MRESPTYTQCVLEKKRPVDGVVLRDTAWIPSVMAKVGKQLEIRKADGPWDPGWAVVERGLTWEARYVAERARDFTRTRKASDI